MSDITPVYECDAHKLLIGDVLRQCGPEYTSGELSLEKRAISFEVDKSDEVWKLTITDKASDTTQTIKVIPAYVGKTGPRRYAICPTCKEQKMTVWLHPQISEWLCKECAHVRQRSKSQAQLKKRVRRFIERMERQRKKGEQRVGGDRFSV